MTISACILHRKAAFREISWVQAFHSMLVFSQGNQILHSTYDHTEVFLHDFTHCETHPSSQ